MFYSRRRAHIKDMSAGTLMLRLCLGLLSVCVPLGSAVQINITAEHGKKVILPCQVPNNSKPIVGVEWSRPDLEPYFVLFYRDGHFELLYQHPSFKNRAYLQDSEVKHGNVSLILENVMTDDEGIYECRVKTRMGHRKRAHLTSDPISTINMTVVPSGHQPRNKHAICCIHLRNLQGSPSPDLNTLENLSDSILDANKWCTSLSAPVRTPTPIAEGHKRASSSIQKV